MPAKDAYNRFLEEINATAVLSESFSRKLQLLMMKAVEDAYNNGVAEGKRLAEK